MSGPGGAGRALDGPRAVIRRGEAGYPVAFGRIAQPPAALYVVGDASALVEGIAVVGARKATPYGIGCAKRFAQAAARRGVCVISGGARGCDAAAHAAALEAGGRTVVFLGGGCDELYPAENAGLFQRVVEGGGAVVSEHDWHATPRPYYFRARNRLIAGLARATLIVEAGLPSGTFSTADEALAAGRDVLVVPGAITSPASRGANRLLWQGATPVVDDESFDEELNLLFGPPLAHEAPSAGPDAAAGAPPAARVDPLVAAAMAEPLGMEQLLAISRGIYGPEKARVALMSALAEGERAGLVARHPDGRWGPVVR